MSNSLTSARRLAAGAVGATAVAGAMLFGATPAANAAPAPIPTVVGPMHVAPEAPPGFHALPVRGGGGHWGGGGWGHHGGFGRGHGGFGRGHGGFGRHGFWGHRGWGRHGGFWGHHRGFGGGHSVIRRSNTVVRRGWW
jgi:hypothetical protein